jgi:hypothetical protein
MHLRPGSEVAPNMVGQPPGSTAMLCSRQEATAFSDMLPVPMPRCRQTRGTPAVAQSATRFSAPAGVVKITTPSSRCGIEAMSGSSDRPSPRRRWD